MNVKITLVLPNVYTYSRQLDIDCKEPLGILYIASYLRSKGYNVDIIDAATYGLSVGQTAMLIEESNADIVGFSVVQRTIDTTVEVVKKLRSDGCSAHFTLGGYLPTLSASVISTYKEFEQCIDSFMIGEGEITWFELAEALSTGKDWKSIKGMAWIEDEKAIFSKPREKIENLDSLPFPARDLLPRVMAMIGTASIFSSRGCYGNCTFCSQNAFDSMNPGPSWRGRSAKNVVDEIEYLINKFSVKTIKFNDDNIFGPGEKGKQRVVEICEEILKRKLNIKLMAYCRANDVDLETMKIMKKAGFERILLGVESTNDEILKRYKKGVTFDVVKGAIEILGEVGMSFIPGYMMFNPYTTVDELKKSLDFLRVNKAYGVTISKSLLIYDSTEIKSIMEDQGRLVSNDIRQGYHKYKVSEEIGKIYEINKYLWAKYIDPLNRDSKFIISALKKRPSFNDRQKWEEVLEKKWLIQADFMEQSMYWNENTSEREIRHCVESTVTRFNKLNDYLIKELPGYENTSYPEYNIAYFNINGKDYFMDVHTSKVIKIDNPLMKRILFKMMSENRIEYVLEQYEDKYTNEEIEEVKQLFQNNFVAQEYIKPQFPTADEFYRHVRYLLTQKGDYLLYENYVWEEKK